MALRWELFMALAMLGSLGGPSLGPSHGFCYAWELRWPFVGIFCVFAMLGCLNDPLLGAFQLP